MKPLSNIGQDPAKNWKKSTQGLAHLSKSLYYSRKAEKSNAINIAGAFPENSRRRN